MALRMMSAVPESLEAVDASDSAVFDRSFGEFVTIVAPGGDLIVLAAVTKLDPSKATAAVALGTLRAETIPETFDGKNAEAFVGRQAAFAADYCELPGVLDGVSGHGLPIEGYRPPDDIIPQARRIVSTAEMDLGGVEYLLNDRDGEAYFYDMNALPNFVADAAQVVRFDPFVELAEFIGRWAKRSVATL